MGDTPVEPKQKRARVLGEMMMPPVIAKALVAIQRDLKPLTKTSVNGEYGSGFVPLDEVMPKAMELLTRHKIAVVQPPVSDDNDHIALQTMLVHESGVAYSTMTRLALSKADPQGHGSAITYMRRYALMSILGMTAEDDDDDGNKASGVSTAATEEQRGQIVSLMQTLNIGADQIAKIQRNIRTRDHASEFIVKYERLISAKAREREAEKAALDTEQKTKHIPIEDGPQAHPISKRIEKLGLIESKVVFAATSKPFIGKCDEDELGILNKTLDTIETGKVNPPAAWYRDGRRPNQLPGDDKPKQEKQDDAG